MRTSIKAIIFDVDGTLYPPIPGLSKELNRHWISTIQHQLAISEAEAKSRLVAYTLKHKSKTMALSAMGMGTIAHITYKAEKHMRSFYRDLLLKDRKLIGILRKLKLHYTLATLRNGTKFSTRFILGQLGFNPRRERNSRGFGPFDYILPTIELGVTKPDVKVFSNALGVLKLPAPECLIIGDRVEVDLVPAKRLGMKTALVTWGEKPKNTDGVDAMMETIYDIKELISR